MGRAREDSAHIDFWIIGIHPWLWLYHFLAGSILPLHRWRHEGKRGHIENYGSRGDGRSKVSSEGLPSDAHYTGLLLGVLLQILWINILV